MKKSDSTSAHQSPVNIFYHTLYCLHIIYYIPVLQLQAT